MNNKTARKSMTAAQAAAPDKIKLTAEQAVQEIRNLRAGKLVVGNMEYVDALLSAYDRVLNEIYSLQTHVPAMPPMSPNTPARDKETT